MPEGSELLQLEVLVLPLQRLLAEALVDSALRWAVVWAQTPGQVLWVDSAPSQEDSEHPPRPLRLVGSGLPLPVPPEDSVDLEVSEVRPPRPVPVL